MSELIIVISIMGILASIIIPNILGTDAGIRKIVAEERLELLNQALARYIAIKGPVGAVPLNGHLHIAQLLSERDLSIPGSPLIPTQLQLINSENTNDYRFIYNGKRFELALPGQIGRGLKMMFDGT
jgi:type II secretory pathway pseudopilin PulG